jgi:hypothetical protein
MKYINTLLLSLLLTVAFAQEEPNMESASDQNSSETAPNQEPQPFQQYVLYGMTAVGVVLIGISVSRTKLFKKK